MRANLALMEKPLLAVLAALALAGCAAGPDFKRPVATAPLAYTKEPLPAATDSSTDVQRLLAGMDLPAEWWTLFRSPALNELVEAALKANPNLQAAEASLRQARELVQAQRGFYLPTVQAGFSPTRQGVAANTLSPTINSSATVYNLYTGQLSVSYNPDVFGANRRQVETLQALADAQRFQVEAAYVTLTANLVAAAIQEASLRAQIHATESIVQAQRETQRLFQKQFDLGAIAQSEVVAQAAQLAQIEATLPPLNKALAIERDLIAALAGRLPAEGPAESFDLSTLELPADLPLSLPSELVDHRPDVRAAEEQLHAASAQIGMAAANRLPSFSITAERGAVATVLSQLFQSGNAFWALGAGVSQTVFAGGTLAARQRAAQAGYDQAAAQYRASVINAFQNVADALYALQFDAEALAAQTKAEQAASQSLDYAKKAYSFGATTSLALITATQTYQQAALNLAQARAARYTDTVALFQALGGGWWNRPQSAGSSR